MSPTPPHSFFAEFVYRDNWLRSVVVVSGNNRRRRANGYFSCEWSTGWPAPACVIRV